MGRTIVLAGVLVAAAAWGQEAARPSLAVLELEARGAEPLKAQAVGSGVARGIRQLDVFTVLSAEDVRQLLAIERSRALLGGGAGELRSMNEALGARHAITGSVTKVGEGLSVELRLLDSADGKVLSQRSMGPAPLEALVRDVPGLAQELLTPLLASQQGTLWVRASEEAAEIVVDDVLRGSTPLREPLSLSRGSHRLQVRKDGFIADTRPVRIEPGRATTEEVELAPSADYAEAWRLRHGRLRVGAYIATAAALGSLAGAYLLDRDTDALYRERFVPSRAALENRGTGELESLQQQGEYQECLAAGRELCAARTEEVASRLRTQQYVTAGLLGLGAVATGAASYLWLTGEDPNRYGGVVAGVSLGPAPGFALAGRF